EDAGSVVTVFRPATGRCQHTFAFTVEGDAFDRVFVAFHHNKLVAARDIPNTSSGITNGNRHALAIWRKDRAVDLACVRLQHGELGTALRVPNAHSAVLASGEDARAVWAVGRNSDISRMSPEHTMEPCRLRAARELAFELGRERREPWQAAARRIGL